MYLGTGKALLVPFSKTRREKKMTTNFTLLNSRQIQHNLHDKSITCRFILTQVVQRSSHVHVWGRESLLCTVEPVLHTIKMTSSIVCL